MLTNYFLSAEERAELQLFTDALERFCDTEIEPHYRAWEKAGQVPRELFTRMGAQGYLCADVPEQYGSSGASVHFSFAVVEVLSRRGYGGLVGGLQVHNDIIPPYLLHCGTEATSRRSAPPPNATATTTSSTAARSSSATARTATCWCWPPKPTRRQAPRA